MKWIKKYPMCIEFKSVQEFKKFLCEPLKALFYGHFPWNFSPANNFHEITVNEFSCECKLNIISIEFILNEFDS